MPQHAVTEDFYSGRHSLEIECNTAFACFPLKDGHAQQLHHSHLLEEPEDTKVGQKVSLMPFNLVFYSCFQGTCKHPAWHTVENNKCILNQYCKWQMRFRATLSYFHLGHQTAAASARLCGKCARTRNKDRWPMSVLPGKWGLRMCFPTLFLLDV